MNGRQAKATRRMAINSGFTKRQARLILRAHKRKASQNPKPMQERRHVAAGPRRATWPHTPDQKRQSRPVIVMGPVRAMLRDTEHPRTRRRIRAAGNWMPKHMLDAGEPHYLA